MILYLTKVILCSAAFWAFYRLVLQREQMFGFNRIYLLLTPILAVFIPFYQIEVLVPSVADAPVMMLPASSGSVIMESVEPSWTIWDYACALYLLVAAMLLIRLLINLVRIMHSTRQAKTYQWREKTIVTLPKEVVPYSFLDYIFISENATDQETLLQHEYAHSRQWHSADILVIEVLQIIFWCNPVLHLYRRSMRLNHEFLADAATINHTSIKDYQRLLLQVATAHDKHYLASGFNYFFIKNRLEMMTKTTSTVRRRVLQSLAALLLVVMTFFAAERVYAQSNDGAEQIILDHSALDSVKPSYIKINGERSNGVQLSQVLTNMTYKIVYNNEDNSIDLVDLEPLGDRIPHYIIDLPSYLDQFDGLYLDGKRISKERLLETHYNVTDYKITPERAEREGNKKHLICRKHHDKLKSEGVDSQKRVFRIHDNIDEDIETNWASWLKTINEASSDDDIFIFNGKRVSIEELNNIDITQYKAFYCSGEYDFQNIRGISIITAPKK